MLNATCISLTISIGRLIAKEEGGFSRFSDRA